MKKVNYKRRFLVLCVFLVFVIICVLVVKNNKVPYGAQELEAFVAEVYENRDAIVTIVSDDGFYDTAVWLNKLCEKHKLRCSVAGAVCIVDPYLDEWKNILNDGNIDLVSHSYNHIAMHDEAEIANNLDELTHEIVDADTYYESNFGEEQIVFVCPENKMCENGYKILKDNEFYAVRRGNRGYNSLSPQEGVSQGNWFNLMIKGIGDEETDARARNAWIDEAVMNKYWLIEMWHNVAEFDDGGFQTMLVSEADEHLDYIAQKSQKGDVWVATYTEAVKYIREKQNVEIWAYLKDDSIYVGAELNDKKMSPKVFNHPITVMIKANKEIEEKAVSLQFEEINGEKFLKVNIVQGGEETKVLIK